MICPQCQSKGVLWVRHRDSGDYWIEICGDCENWRRHFDSAGQIKVGHRAELEAKGYRVWPPKIADDTPWVKPDKTIEQVAEEVAEKKDINKR